MIDPAQLEADAARIAQLLEEVRELVTPPAWQRVEDLVRRIVGLYGAGLAHALEHARAAGAPAPAFDARLADDDLLASLLVLHGLHPLSTEERIGRALVLVRGQLGLGDEELVLVELAEGVARLRAGTDLGGGAMSSRVAEGVVRRALESAAPELRGVELAGLPPPRDPSLVQIRTRRPAP